LDMFGLTIEGYLVLFIIDTAFQNLAIHSML
jgi:hypothetical protein